MPTPRKPKPEAIAISDARPRLTELVNRVEFGKEQFVILKNGKPVAALVQLDGAA